MTTCAIVTPSFYRDFEQCGLLAESVLRFVPPDVHHYLLIDRRDEALFAPLRGPRTHLATKEDILPWWLAQVPVMRSWWASLKSPPVRGWIVQQLTKLSVNFAVPSDVFVFLDSGAFFVQPYDPRERLRGDRAPLFREEGPANRTAFNTRWHRIAAGLLGLEKKNDYTTSYVGNLVYWRRDNLVRLQRHIAEVAQLSEEWVTALCRLPTLSEYVLYGMFCEHVLGARSGHYFESTIHAYSHWSEAKLEESQLKTVRGRLGPDCAVVMINEKSRTPPALIRRVFAEGQGSSGVTAQV